jgi:hypothetical protein
MSAGTILWESEPPRFDLTDSEAVVVLGSCTGSMVMVWMPPPVTMKHSTHKQVISVKVRLVLT